MCLSATYSTVRIGNFQPQKYPIQNILHEGSNLSPLLSVFVLEYAIRRVQENQEWLKLKGTHQLSAYAGDINIVGKT
jgi:hypothetical protein